MLLFGDLDGNLMLTDRNFKLMWKNKVFKGAVKGLAYVLDPLNHRRQFIFAVGDELVYKTSASEQLATASTQEKFYMLKVGLPFDSCFLYSCTRCSTLPICRVRFMYFMHLLVLLQQHQLLPLLSCMMVLKLRLVSPLEQCCFSLVIIFETPPLLRP